MNSDNKKILFICLGNICRSPIAEAVFLKAIKTNNVESNWEVDSAAIGAWHVGKSPDSRAVATMKTHDLPYSNKARQVKFLTFFFVFWIYFFSIYRLGRMTSINLITFLVWMKITLQI